MARNNRFLESSSNLMEMYNNETLIGPATQEVIDHSPIPDSNNILYADAKHFIPYDDDKLRMKLHTGEEREQLLQSIKENGIMYPVICAKNEDGKLQILAGHNRVDICKELDIQVPYILKEGLTKREKDLIVIDTNLLNRQRNEYKPTHFAYILKIKYQDLTNEELGPTVPTTSLMGEEYNLSRKTIYRYLKLNDLIDAAKNAVDNKEISFRVAIELAYLKPEVQMIILNYMNEYTINEKNLHELRININDIQFKSNEDLVAYIRGQLDEKNNKKRIFDFRNVKKYIPKDIPENEIEDFVINAIKAYRKY